MIEFINQTLLSTWYEKCPEIVRRRWGLGDKIPPGIAAKIGHGVHYGAEVNNKAKILSGRDEPRSVILQAAVEGYHKSITSEGVYFEPGESQKTSIQDGENQVLKLSSLYCDAVAPNIVPQLVEETIWLEVAEDLPPFRGILDVMDMRGRVRDLKNVNRKWPQSRVDHSMQAIMYTGLAASLSSNWPNGFTFDILIKGKTPAAQRLSTSPQKEDFRLLIERARVMMKTIQQGIFQPAAPGHWICGPKYCGYFWSCPYIPAYKKSTK